MNRRTPNIGKRILIVGGAGYIGSEVNKRLHQHGYQTVILDNLSHGNVKCVPYGEFIKSDINHPLDLEHVFQQYFFDGVMHFAALTDVGESTVNPLAYYQNNVASTLNLLNCAVKYAVKAFVFSSSAAIFGIPQTPLIDENHPCQPINPYGQTKWMVEKILQDFDRAYGLKSCSFRYFNAAGADPEGEIGWYPRKENNLIPLLLKSLFDRSKRVTLFGSDYPTPDGSCIRD
ncbi:MAG: UDP-glucose 4-epimerase GalE, partial [Parachlamydiaceae bacterium]